MPGRGVSGWSPLRAPRAEEESGAAKDALRGRIRTDDSLPDENWWTLERHETLAVFASLHPGAKSAADAPLLRVVSFRGEGDDWVEEPGPNDCQPQAVRDARLPVEWRPAEEALASGQRRQSLLLRPGGCRGGEPLDVDDVTVDMTVSDESIVVQFFTEPPSGGLADCIGNPESQVTIELSEEPGQRPVIDGSRLPPRSTRSNRAVPCLSALTSRQEEPRQASRAIRQAPGLGP